MVQVPIFSSQRHPSNYFNPKETIPTSKKSPKKMESLTAITGSVRDTWEKNFDNHTAKACKLGVLPL